jgi:hypothetical protein
MFISVPVYAEDNEVYTLEPGKVYKFEKVIDENLVAEFSDYVLYNNTYNYYNKVNSYQYVNYINNGSSHTNVYNCNNKSVTMTITGGEISEVTVYGSLFSLVMYDGTETEFKIINNIDDSVNCRKFEYNESDNSFEASGLNIQGSRTLTGKGFLLFKLDDEYYNTTFNGVYEISNYIESDFFQVPPPWILKKMMNLTELLGAFWNQLLTLLPVGLVILSAFLLTSLLIYTVRLFL